MPILVSTKAKLPMRSTELTKIIEQAQTKQSVILDLSAKNLTSLPDNIGSLSSVTYLNLAGNKLTALPESIGNLTNLTRLDLEYNQLTTLPNSIGKLINLNYLYIHGNPIDSLPVSIKNLDKLILTTVDISNIAVLKLIQNTPNLSKSNSLHSSFSPRYWIDFSEWEPKWLLDEPNIKIRHLLLKNVKYEKICKELNAIKVELESNYTRLTIGSTHVTYDFGLHYNLYASREHVFSPQGKTIYIKINSPSDNYINIIHDIPDLTRLGLEQNQLNILSERIGNFIDIKALFLANNQLNCLPESISNLVKLEELSLENNKLTSFPDPISNLNLTELNLGSNNLTTISEKIGNISTLTRLRLENNQLTSLPDAIGNLTNLTEINLDNNQLTILPDGINNLINLRSLSLSGNPLVDLSTIENLPKLQTVYFLGVNLPRRYWTNFSDWNPKWLLDEDNAEVKRILIDRVGYEKICRELNAIQIDVWREYTLLKINSIERVYDHEWSWHPIDLEPMVLLKMTCPSTKHIHILRVPPEMVSAEEAITWVNHGIHPDRISVQT